MAIKQEPVEPAGVYLETPVQFTSSEAAVTLPVSVIETPALPVTAAMGTNQYAQAHASLVSHDDVRAATCDAAAVASDEQEMPLALTTKPAVSSPAHDINSSVRRHQHKMQHSYQMLFMYVQGCIITMIPT